MVDENFVAENPRQLSPAAKAQKAVKTWASATMIGQVSSRENSFNSNAQKFYVKEHGSL